MCFRAEPSAGDAIVISPKGPSGGRDADEERWPRHPDYRLKGRRDYGAGRYRPPHDRYDLYVAEAVGADGEFAERHKENQDYDSGYLYARRRAAMAEGHAPADVFALMAAIRMARG